MKKFLACLMCLFILSASAVPAFAGNGCRKRGSYQSSRYYRDRDRGSRRAYYSYRDRRSFWDKHRDKLTLAIGTGAGAAMGGLMGGKSGAGIGALLGAGGSALYTYKLRKRNRDRWR
jgi:outer membrane lipoprotein SlyB